MFFPLCSSLLFARSLWSWTPGYSRSPSFAGFFFFTMVRLGITCMEELVRCWEGLWTSRMAHTHLWRLRLGHWEFKNGYTWICDTHGTIATFQHSIGLSFTLMNETCDEMTIIRIDYSRLSCSLHGRTPLRNIMLSYRDTESKECIFNVKTVLPLVFSLHVGMFPGNIYVTSLYS
jgi:hypothetical protein